MDVFNDLVQILTTVEMKVDFLPLTTPGIDQSCKSDGAGLRDFSRDVILFATVLRFI